MSKDRVYDDLLCFLGDPIFQIPVRTFMDENCLIFDPSMETGDEHMGVHTKYKKMIDTLLEGFCKDANITTEEAIKGVDQLSEIPDIKEVFHVLFEQVLAATDFNIFKQVMTKRNILIQEQVLVMIIAATGGLPESMMPQGKGKGAAAQGAPHSQSQMTGADDKQEEELLKQVMQQSKKDADKHASLNAGLKKREDEELRKIVDMSKKEAVTLQGERKQLEEDMRNLAIGGPPVGVHTTSSKPPTRAPQTQQRLPPQASQNTKVSGSSRPGPPQKRISGTEAASEWMKSAQAESGGVSSTHTAMAANLAGLSPEELQKRQTFLREQRDKLLAMKKEAREKQLGVATKTSGRPQSARAARSAMNADEAPSSSKKEDEKKMAMRRAIAERLRQEVIGE